MNSKWWYLPVFSTFVACCWLAWQIRDEQRQIDRLQADFAEIHRINYGLFNMQEWKEKAFYVFTGHIEQFQISPNAYKEAEAELKKYLYGIYDKYIGNGAIFNEVIAKAEKSNKVNKMLLKLFKDNINEQIEALNIKQNIPSMARQLAAELKKNEPRFQQLMQEELVRLLQYKDKYSYKDPRFPVYQQYQCEDLTCAKTKITQQLEGYKSNQRQYNTLLMGLVALSLAFLFLLYYKGRAAWAVAGITLFSVLLLGLGISLPMIVIDARLNSFVFNLFEQDLSFAEQVVFFQSKSILDVTQNLIESRGYDLKIVGIMILCFSVIFPLIKLILGGFSIIQPCNKVALRAILFFTWASGVCPMFLWWPSLWLTLVSTACLMPNWRN